MAWAVTSDPERFEEAESWFKRKNHIPAEEAKKLDAQAKRRAFWVSGAAQLQIVTDVHDEIRKAIETGSTLEQFKKAVGDKLKAAWAGSVKNPAWRIETIYRTNVQSAYSAGRWKQLQNPQLAKYRPYMLFDAVLDSRTSEICSACDGTVLHRDDPWWTSHVPPLHHCCRSSFRALTPKQAERKGITTEVPKDENGNAVAPKDGFGALPQEAEWQPQADKYPPELWKEFEKKTKGGPPAEVETELPFTPGVHVEQFSTKWTPKETAEALTFLDADVHRGFLKQYPLKRLDIGKLHPADPDVLGFYKIFKQELAVSKLPRLIKQDISKGTVGIVAHAARTPAEARQMVLAHEYAHHIVRSLDLKWEKAHGYKLGKSKAISLYAAQDADEYFAECYVAYKFFPEELLKRDPSGYAMIRNALVLAESYPP